MRKIIFAICLVLSIIACHYSSASSTPTKNGDLNGNVKIIKDLSYHAKEKFGEIVPGELKDVEIRDYDKDGNCVKSALYSDDGDLLWKTEFIYKKGEEVSELTDGILGKSEDRVVERRKNYVKWAKHYGTNHQFYLEEYYEGTTFYIKNENGEITRRTFYDKNGRVIEDETLLSGLNKSTREVYEYDKKGLLVSKTTYSNAKKEKTLTYKYPVIDKKGNWTTQYVYNNGVIEEIVKREITYR